MGEVAVTINTRTYRISCGDGEEERLKALAEHVRARVEKLASEFGRAGDDRLLLMATLLITDELFELREALGDRASDESKPEKAERTKAAGGRKPSAA